MLMGFDFQRAVDAALRFTGRLDMQYGQTMYAPVCGIQMYERMAILNRMPYYNLLLAHDIVSLASRRDRYEDLFQAEAKKHGPHRTTILDNSITELGSAVDLATIAQAALAVRANVIVLPDVYKDSQQTIESCEEAYPQWKEYFDKLLGEDQYSFMMVPQGKTIEEFARCVEHFSLADKFPHIHWWGVPRNAVELHGSRKPALHLCKMLAPWRAIHLLGFSDNLVDDVMCARDPHVYVRGIDSAVPMRAGYEAKNMSLSLKIGPRRPEWLTDIHLTDWDIRNWEYAQWLFGGH